MWRRSLQLRVVTTTTVLTIVVIAVLGNILLTRVRDGLLDDKVQAALTEAASGCDHSTGVVQLRRPGVRRGRLRHVVPRHRVPAVVGRWSGGSERRGAAAGRRHEQGGCAVGRDVARDGPVDDPGIAARRGSQQRPRSSGATACSAARRARPSRPSRSARWSAWRPTATTSCTSSSRSTRRARRSALVRQGLGLAAIGLVLLVGGIGWLVTRQVVTPVRMAARIAERLSAGRLEERMRVRGEDDLARLATSFNKMAISLQRQIRQLEDLSRVQRRFVSDVSHELRTPLTTVRMAADVLHEARGRVRPGDRAQRRDPADPARPVRGAAGRPARDQPLRRRRRRPRDGTASTCGWWPSRSSRRWSRSPSGRGATWSSARRGRRASPRSTRGGSSGCCATCSPTPSSTARASRSTCTSWPTTRRSRSRFATTGWAWRPGEAAMVFNRFWRADPARARTTGGTGLGLSISMEDAHLHGGWLQVWGETGDGSQFRLTVPREPGIELDNSPIPLEPMDSARRRRPVSVGGPTSASPSRRRKGGARVAPETGRSRHDGPPSSPYCWPSPCR